MRQPARPDLWEAWVGNHPGPPGTARTDALSMTSFFVASTVVTLVQYLRVREARLLPLLAMFAMLALAHSRDDWRASRAFHLVAGAAGLVLLVMLSPRHPASH